MRLLEVRRDPGVDVDCPPVPAHHEQTPAEHLRDPRTLHRPLHQRKGRFEMTDRGRQVNPMRDRAQPDQQLGALAGVRWLGEATLQVADRRLGRPAGQRHLRCAVQPVGNPGVICWRHEEQVRGNPLGVRAGLTQQPCRQGVPGQPRVGRQLLVDRRADERVHK